MIKPLGDRVVVEVAEVELKTKSGIIMPETSKEKPQKGSIVAVGTDKEGASIVLRRGLGMAEY